MMLQIPVGTMAALAAAAQELEGRGPRRFPIDPAQLLGSLASTETEYRDPPSGRLARHVAEERELRAARSASISRSTPRTSGRPAPAAPRSTGDHRRAAAGANHRADRVVARRRRRRREADRADARRRHRPRALSTTSSATPASSRAPAGTARTSSPGSTAPSRRSPSRTSPSSAPRARAGPYGGLPSVNACSHGRTCSGVCDAELLVALRARASARSLITLYGSAFGTASPERRRADSATDRPSAARTSTCGEIFSHHCPTSSGPPTVVTSPKMSAVVRTPSLSSRAFASLRNAGEHVGLAHSLAVREDLLRQRRIRLGEADVIELDLAEAHLRELLRDADVVVPQLVVIRVHPRDPLLVAPDGVVLACGSSTRDARAPSPNP